LSKIRPQRLNFRGNEVDILKIGLKVVKIRNEIARRLRKSHRGKELSIFLILGDTINVLNGGGVTSEWGRDRKLLAHTKATHKVFWWNTPLIMYQKNHRIFYIQY
jgi:hypothetical protein